MDLRSLLVKYGSAPSFKYKSLFVDLYKRVKIAKDSGIRTNHISKVLSELKGKEIVECINEEARKGRLYRLTSTGKEVLDNIKDIDEEDKE